MESKLIKQKNSDIFLFSTSVENLFINELLPIAPGDYVKIYLFYLMYAEQEQTISNEKAAQVLGVTPDKMDKAWRFWEEKGAVKRVYGDPDTGEDDRIIFLSQIEDLYGAKSSDSDPSAGSSDAAEAKLVDMEMRALFTEYEDAKGNAISQKEMERISETVNEFKVSPDVFSYAIRYCAELDKVNIDYISKVALKWREEGCEDIAQVKALLDKYSKRNVFYKRVFGEMGFNRMPNPADKEMMARWFDEWGYSLDEVLGACRLTGGMREPSLKYVNKVLENKRLEAGGIKTGTGAKNDDKANPAKVSKRVLDEYLKALRDEDERKHKAKIDEVCGKDPRVEKALLYLSDLNKNILSFDFSPEAKAKRAEQKERKQGLEGALQKLLEEDGYPANYLDMKYKCDICKDTGITDEGKNCACLKLRANEAYKWNTERNR